MRRAIHKCVSELRTSDAVPAAKDPAPEAVNARALNVNPVTLDDLRKSVITLYDAVLSFISFMEC